MTPSEQEESAAAYLAAMRGEEVELFIPADANGPDRWVAKSPKGDWYLCCRYRRKPKPALVPWECAEDVPLNLLFRNKSEKPDMMLTVAEYHRDGLRLSAFFWSFRELFDVWEHSTDRKNWLPCGKEKA